jgi:ribonuclease HI
MEYQVVLGALEEDMSPSTRVEDSDLKSFDLLQFDGLSIPNPGKGSSGAILFSSSGDVVFERGDYLGDTTNNIAEYTGLLIGIEECVKRNITSIRIEGDSLLVVNQVSGKWQVKDAKLKVLHQTVMAMFNRYFKNVAIRHVYRDKNKDADRITNEVMKLGYSFLK